MIKWLSMFLRNGRSHTGQSLMNSSAIDELFDIHNHFPNPLGLRQDNFVVDSAALGYGLGWVVGNYRGINFRFKVDHF